MMSAMRGRFGEGSPPSSLTRRFDSFGSTDVGIVLVVSVASGRRSLLMVEALITLGDLKGVKDAESLGLKPRWLPQNP